MRGCFGAGTRNASVSGCSSYGFFRTSINRLTCASMIEKPPVSVHVDKQREGDRSTSASFHGTIVTRQVRYQCSALWLTHRQKHFRNVSLDLCSLYLQPSLDDKPRIPRLADPATSFRAGTPHVAAADAQDRDF